MSRILHLEAGPPGCSVAISQDGVLLGELVSDREAIADMMVLCHRLLESLELSVQHISAVSIPAGPGSYTSLRTGYAMAKGLCESLQIPLICLPSLEILLHAGISSLPQDSLGPSKVLCLMHARKNQFLGQLFDAPEKKALGELIEIGSVLPEEYQDLNLAISNSETVMSLTQGLPGKTLVLTKNASDQLVPAWNRFHTSQYDDLIQATPLYVYDPYITKPKPKFYN
jgi:tRNA threonylcarbamoyladenosine biosynthesis protein TsaB